MDRLDKVIVSQTNYSRKDVKKLIIQKRILVNNKIALKPEYKVDIVTDIIKIDDKEINFQKYVYLILNKPKGFISATKDKKQKTVLDLVPEKYKNRDLFPAGRLDKDTTGLMIITDDGDFAHNILSPRKHVIKEYEVVLDFPVTEAMKEGFKNGVNLNDGECKSADLVISGEYTCNVILREGRYHQIKRMFGCFGAKVIELNRVSIGNLRLPIDLKIGDCRELSIEEKNRITEYKGSENEYIKKKK